MTDLPDRPSVHRPIEDKDVCNGKVWLPEDMAVIVPNNCPGALEQMMSREADARGADKNATEYRVKRHKENQKHSKLKESARMEVGCQDLFARWVKRKQFVFWQM